MWLTFIASRATGPSHALSPTAFSITARGTASCSTALPEAQPTFRAPTHVRFAARSPAPLLSARHAFASPPGGEGQPDRTKRERRNKYARFSKAEEVQGSLRFSNVNSAREGSGQGCTEQEVSTNTGHAGRERGVWTYPDAAQIDQRDPASFGFTEVGVVLGAHGTRGELRVKSDSDFAVERLCTPGKLWLRRPRRRAPRELGLLSGRKGPGNGMWLLMLEGVGTRDAAAALRGASLHVRRELQPTLREDEILLWQLEGLTVVRATRGSKSFNDGEVLGKISGVIPREEITGDPHLGHDLLEIEKTAVPRNVNEDGVNIPYQEENEFENARDRVLIPYVDEIVTEVRLEDGVVLICPPEGLLDLVQPKKVSRVVVRGLLPQYAESLHGSDGRAQEPGLDQPLDMDIQKCDPE
ncbi:hypothetical protein AB1Y20_019960 [Prymnesium parvum]|uniref:RimM N-terminal domain-containing protein n=1 Tax=Prymnesium parvum TaxID=97485 RepID=A0AB34JW05_PRYPA